MYGFISVCVYPGRPPVDLIPNESPLDLTYGKKRNETKRKKEQEKIKK